METLWKDIRYALRILRKNPGFTAVAVVTLALGIGANTTMFSIVYGVLLQPLPYPNPQQLVAVARTAPQFQHPVPVSGPNFLDWRARTRSLEGMSGYDRRGFTVVLGAEPENILGAAVSPGFFPLLGARPVLGRDFLSDEEHSGHDHVAIASYGFWRDRFGGDPNWVGRSFIVNGQSFTLIGVLPADFRLVLAPRSQMFVPLNLDNTDRGNNFMGVLARTKPGTSLRQAQAEMGSIARALEKEYPEANAEQGAVVIPLLTVIGQNVRTALLVLLAAVGLVLLITCANIANVVMAVSARRQGEVAVRAALGAARSRLARQFLTESVLLSLLGGGLGLLVAYLGLDLFRALSPGNVPRLDEVAINSKVLLFSFGLCFLAGLGSGLAPALRATRANLSDTLKEKGMRLTAGAARSLARRTLVVAEIALALVLLDGAGLALRSFLKMLSTDPGYDPHNLLTFYLSPQKSAYPGSAQIQEFYRRVTENARAVPGVLSVSMSLSVPPGGNETDGPVVTSEHPDMDPHRAPDIIMNPISPNYFETMRLPLRAGRAFTEMDRAGSPQVVILNETAAHSLFSNPHPIGERVKLGVDDFKEWWTIVGIVTDERFFGWDTDREPEAYVPAAQALRDDLPAYDMAMVIRSAGDPLSLVPAMRRAVAAVNDQMALLGPQSVEQRMENSFAPHRFNMLLLGTFAALALVLAAIGIYGVMAQFVAMRTHEIGIRVALGATRGNVLRMVLGQGVRLSLLGTAIGALAAVALTQFIRSLLYGVSATDPLTFLAVAALLIGIALLACYLPAIRAAKVDPIIALRYE